MSINPVVLKEYYLLVTETGRSVALKKTAIFKMLQQPLTSSAECINLEKELSSLDAAVTSLVNDPRKNVAFREKPKLKTTLTKLQQEVAVIRSSAITSLNQVPASVYLEHMSKSVTRSLALWQARGFIIPDSLHVGSPPPLPPPPNPRKELVVQTQKLIEKVTALTESHKVQRARLLAERERIQILQNNLALTRIQRLEPLKKAEEIARHNIEATKAEHRKQASEILEMRDTTHSQIVHLSALQKEQQKACEAAKMHAATLDQEQEAAAQEVLLLTTQYENESNELTRVFNLEKASLLAMKNLLKDQQADMRREHTIGERIPTELETHGEPKRDELETANGTPARCHESHQEHLQPDQELQKKLIDYQNAQHVVQEKAHHLCVKTNLMRQAFDEANQAVLVLQKNIAKNAQHLAELQKFLKNYERQFKRLDRHYEEIMQERQDNLQQATNKYKKFHVLYDTKAIELADLLQECDEELAATDATYAQKLHQLEKEQAAAQEQIAVLERLTTSNETDGKAPIQG